MKISALQMDIASTRDENLAKIENHLAAIEGGCDIFVLPEMFTTGFSMDSKNISEPENSQTLPTLQRLAKEHECAICGSVATEQGGNYYNRFYFVYPDGSYCHYDKHHLFRMAGEHNHYTAGDKRVIIEYKGVRIMLQVCYDLRFPVWSRNRSDYDMMIYVASWPTPRVNAWNKLLDARAIENLAFVVGVNRVGDFEGINYVGGTHIIDFKGEKLISAEDNCEQVISYDIDINALNSFREAFPATLDSDDFTLI
ncbi:MAG: amidohydrolase [Rikenellaceae bacterium]